MADIHPECDFVVVGTGAAGLVGAITARLNGMKPIVVEKASLWGGTTAISGGVVWVPGNAMMAAAGKADSAKEVSGYVRRLIGPDATPRQIAKAEGFLSSVNAMTEMLQQQGFRWHRNAEHPDYYPEVEGARIGRTLEPAMFDTTRLGPWRKTLRGVNVARPSFYTNEAGALVRAKSGVRPFLATARVILRDFGWKLTGKKPATLGRALIAALMHMARRLEIPVLIETGLVDIVVENGRAIGVVVEDKDGRRTLDAPAGVLLAAGGYAHNSALRRQYHGDTDGSWSNASPDDQGDGLLAATRAGALAENLEDAWWQATVMVAPGKPCITLGERALPGGIVVDQNARRYMNEAQSYKKGGAVMLAHGAATHSHWIICDDRMLRRYFFEALSNAEARRSMAAHGQMKSADTIEALAAACNLDPETLQATVDRFNGFAKAGVDEDFGRGRSDYDRYWADPANKPNPSLGEIAKAPFHAVRIVPGDLGTNGGIMTDDYGRVLGTGEEPIAGLYAAGNSSSSPFNKTYPGGGATIGAAMTFGYIAARHAAQNRI